MPDSWELRELLSNIHVRQGKLASALMEIQRAYYLIGDHPNVLYNMGLIYFHMDSLTQAREILSHSVDIQASSDAYYLLGQCAEKQGDSTAALYYYQQCTLLSTGQDDRSALEASKKIGTSLEQ